MHYTKMEQIDVHIVLIDILREIQWLSTAERVKFHTSVMTFKCHQKECPKYLYESIQYPEDRQGCISQEIPAKPLHNCDIVSVHFSNFYCMGICNKLSRHLSMLTYIYLNVYEC